MTALHHLMTHAETLDDVTRARMWSVIEDRIADDVAAPAAAGSRRVAIVVGIGIAALAAALVALLVHPAAPDDANVLAVPAGARVSYQIGPHARTALVGPAQLELVGRPGDATTVRLRSGTLLADFTGGPGRSLRIETPAAVVEIVGTLFAIEVRGDVTCTAVSHGRVRVTPRARAAALVGAGERFCTDAPQIEPIPRELDELLAHHAAMIATHDEPANVEPASVEPASVAPASVAPANIEPAKVESPKVEPAKPEHARVEPAPVATTSPAPKLEPAAPVHVATTSPAAPKLEPATPVHATTSPAAPKVEPAKPEPATPVHVATTSPAAPKLDVESTATPTTATAANATTIAPSQPPASSAPIAPQVAASSHAVFPSAVSKPVETPEQVYRRAEAALAARDLVTADHLLASIGADSAVAEEARYERARIAYQRHAWDAARRHLDGLLAGNPGALAEPAHYLRCRIAVERKESGAAACFRSYRTSFPHAAHDLDAVAVLTQDAYARGGCAAAADYLAELSATYPRTSVAASWRSRCGGAR